MKSSTNHNYTLEELERIEWFKNAGPSLREDMIRTYEVIHRTVEDEGIRESCERLLSGMRGGEMRSADHDGQFEDAVDAYEQGNYFEALRIWKFLADQGVGDAQYNLAVRRGNMGKGESQFRCPVKLFEINISLNVNCGR